MNATQKKKQLMDTITKVLTPLIDNDYVYLDLPYYNNLGDVLIWEGTKCFLQTLPYKCLYASDIYFYIPRKLHKDVIILFQGGGNLGDLYREHSCFRRKIIESYPENKVIILPQSIYYDDSSLMKEDIAFYKSKQEIPKVSSVKCKVKRYRRAGLSGLQKKHYAKLYRVGKLKKRPYSQVWKYREDIRKMHKLQEQYLFLARHNIHSAEELVGTIASLTDKKKETSAEKSRIYKARERSRELFTAADEMENLKPAEQSYRLGDTFFEDEHRKWVALEQELQAQGYSLEEVQALRRHYKEEYSEVCAKEKVVFRELNTGKAILNSMIPDSISDGRKTEYNREIIRDRKEQPVK